MGKFTVLAALVASLAAIACHAAVAAASGVFDYEPKLLPGQWRFAFADDGLGWNPTPGQPVTLLLSGRLSHPKLAIRPSEELLLRLRWQAAREPCASSFAADRGIAVHEVPPQLGGRPLTTHSRVQLWYTNEDVGVLAATSDDVDRSGRPAIRVCGWVSYYPRERVRPVTEVIPLLVHLFSAVAIEEGSYYSGPRPDFAAGAQSTAPFSVQENDADCGSTSPGLLTGSVTGNGPGPYGTSELGGGCPGGNDTFAFSTPVLGNLSMTFPLDAALTPGAALVHVGNACDLSESFDQNVAEAEAYAEAQGCVVRRVIAGPEDQAEPAGSVLGFYIDGALVSLVPKGTVVDLVTDGLAPPSTLPAPGGGTLTAPQGGSCTSLASISPKFGSLEHQTEPIKRLSSKSVAVSISVGFTLGSVALCDRAVDDIVGHVHVRDLNLSLSAQYDFHGHRSPAFSYQFAPLRWRVPHNTGAQIPPPPPDVEWSNAITFGGSAGPSLNFTYEPGEPLEPTVDLISVPVGQASETLIEQGRSTLQAALGPQLSFGLTFNRKELAKKEADDVEEGESPETASEQISEQIGEDVGGALETEGAALAPDSAAGAAALVGDAGAVTNGVDGAVSAQLPTDATEIAAQNEALAADGLADAAVDGGVEAIVGDETIEVIAIIVIADAGHHHLPADLVRSHGQIMHARVLAARPIRRLRVRSLHRAPFPQGQIPSLVRSRLDLPVAAQVGRLAVSARRLRPGRRLTVVAPFLGSAGAAQILLSGPGYQATRMLRIAHGTAGGSVRLPRRMAHGTWTISVTDLAGVSQAPGGQALQGFAQVRMGVFRVGRRAHQ